MKRYKQRETAVNSFLSNQYWLGYVMVNFINMGFLDLQVTKSKLEIDHVKFLSTVGFEHSIWESQPLQLEWSHHQHNKHTRKHLIYLSVIYQDHMHNCGQI